MNINPYFQITEMRLKHLYASQQFNKELLAELFSRADEIRTDRKAHSNVLDGRVLGSLFYEPSTRTRWSFESAMLRLGGEVIGTENAREFSSAVKGESIEDTIRVVSNYVDCIVLRHNEDGAAERASIVSEVPIINAGDGAGQHPTQALLDLYTINSELGRVDGINVAMVGDLAKGRTVRSLSYLLGKYEGVRLNFVSPPNLRVGNDIKEYLEEHKIEFNESEDLAKVLPQSDIIYMTRIQKERMPREDYENAKGKYVINQENLSLIRQHARIMHPLPHVEEIDLPLKTEQSDPRVAYFRQVKNGLYARMALLSHLLEE